MNNLLHCNFLNYPIQTLFFLSSYEIYARPDRGNPHLPGMAHAHTLPSLGHLYR